VSGVRVHRVTDRATTRAAFEDIGEQGEGPTTSPEEKSHFERFRLVYRGAAPVLGFPAAGQWTPTRKVPTDPTPAGCPDADTRRWVELADLGYGLLLGLVEHYLVSTGDDRDLLTAWIFTEMRTRLGYLAPKLTTLPTGAPDGGVAGMPFTLPTPIHLPGLETARWQLHARASRPSSTRSRRSRPPAAPSPTPRRPTWTPSWTLTGPAWSSSPIAPHPDPSRRASSATSHRCSGPSTSLT
jgi:hypothetical protein